MPTLLSFKAKEHFKKIFLSALFLLPLSLFLAVQTAPQVLAASKCDPQYVYWTLGPDKNTPYLDICQVTLNTSDIDDDFVYVPFENINQDQNQDGISGSGVKSGNTITWLGGYDCSTYYRVSTQGCTGSNFPTDCPLFMTRTSPKQGQNNGTYSGTPSVHVRYPNGREQNRSLGTLGYSYSGCAVATTDLSITKAASYSNAPIVGDVFRYNLNYKVATGNATNVTIVDNYDQTRVRYESLTANSGWNCTDNGDKLTCTIASLTVGAQGTLTYNVTAIAAGNAANTATISSDTQDNNPANNTSSVTVTISPYPEPACSFYASRTNVNYGETTTLNWSVAYATSGSLDANPDVFTPDPLPIPNIPTTGSQVAGPLYQNTTFTLTLTGPGGTKACAPITVTVNPPAAPTCDSFTANPTLITRGGSSTLAWSTSGVITSVFIEPGLGSVAFDGNATVYPVTTTVYTLTVTGPGGTDDCKATVEVKDPPASCTIITTPDEITLGDKTTLNWTSINAVSATLNQGIGSVPVNGSRVVTPAAAGTITYTLTVSTADGQTTNCSAPVIVNPPAKHYDLSVVTHVDDTTVPPNLLTNPANPQRTKLTYDLTASNFGDATMTNITVREDYDQTKIKILTAPGGALDAGNGVIVWTITQMAPGANSVFKYEAELLDSVATTTIVDATHIQSADIPVNQEVNQTNNDSSITVNVSEVNRSSQHKRVTNVNTGLTSTVVHAVEGDELIYTLSYTAGDTNLTGITIVDNDPNFESIFRYADLTNNGGGVFADTDGDGMYNSATFGPFNIPAYQTKEVDFHVKIKSNLMGIGGDYTLRNSYGNDVTVVTLPNLSFQKYVSVDGAPETQNDSAIPGSILTYRLQVTNAGATDATGFVFEDNITDILEYTNVVSLNGGKVETNGQGQSVVSWPATTIPANGTASRSFVVSVKNPLVAGGDYTLRNAYGNAVTVVTIPDVVISKRVRNETTGQSGLTATASGGHLLTYTLTARENVGAADYPNFQFTDNVADILTYGDISNISNGGLLNGSAIVWPATTVPAGQSVNRTFQVTIKNESAWPAGLGYTRTMTNVYGDTVTVTLQGAIPFVDMHIEKVAVAEAATNPPSGTPGSAVTYTLTYRNEGTLDATGITIADDYDEVNLTNLGNISVPAGVTFANAGGRLTFTIGNLSKNSALQTITYTATILATAEHDTDIVNTATIHSTETDHDNSDNQASSLVRVTALQPKQVEITKEANPQIINTDNTLVTYTITVSNREAIALDVNVIDSIGVNGRINGDHSGSLIYQAGSMAVDMGGSGSYNGDIGTPGGVNLVGIQPNRTVKIIYSAMASISGIAANTTSNAINTVTLYYEGESIDSASQTIALVGNSTPSCTLTATPDTILTGASSDLTWTSINAISASLNQGIGAVPVTGTQTVTPAATTPYTLTVVSALGQTASCSATVTVNEPAIYDLAISVHVDDTNVAPNIFSDPNNPIYTDLTYDLTYRNLSNVAMPNVVVTEDYDETKVQILNASGAVDDGSRLTWTIANLNANDSGVFVYEARLLDSVWSGDIIDAAHIESATIPIAQEINQTNNDSSVTVNVNEINRSAMSKRVTNLNTGITSTAIHALAGDEIEYILAYTAGNLTSSGQVITDNDPNFETIFLYANLTDPGTGSFADSDSDGLYDSATFGPFDIPPYQTQEVRFRVRIKTSAELIGLGGDYTLRNSYGNDVTVVSLPNLSQNKFVSVDGAPETQNDSAVPGSSLLYRLSVTNNGASDANGFVIEDDITDILQYTTMANANGGAVNVNANNESILSWPPTTIPAGATVSRTFTVLVNDPLIAGGDYTLRNVYGNAVTVVTIPDIIISKSVSNANNGQSGLEVNAGTGHVLTYTLTARENASLADFPNYQFRDDVTDILEYSTIGAISDGGTLAGGVITWPAVTIPQGGSVSRTFQATVNNDNVWPEGLGYDRVMTNVYGDTVRVILEGSVLYPDLHIEKSVTAQNATVPPSGASGTDVHYTINYRNEGNLNATVVSLTDNYDEASLTNLRNIAVPAGVTFVNDGTQILFTIGNLPINGGGTITYDATINPAAPHGSDIVNTATILSAEVDSDPSDNQSSALVRVASLQIDIGKNSDVAAVDNNGVVTYTITVTNREASPQDVIVQDTIGLNGGHINGANGGILTYQSGSQQIVINGNGTGTSLGDIGTAAGISFTGLTPNRTATITYRAVASNAGVPNGAISNATNTAALIYQGAQVYTATRTVGINGPVPPPCVGCNGGGGGGGGGGGSLKAKESATLALQKLVSSDGKNYLDAESESGALILKTKSSSLKLYYKIVVKNTSPVSLVKMQIQDIFKSMQSQIKVGAIENIAGANYQDGIFTLDKILANKSAEITYTMSVNTSKAISNLAAYNEVTVLDYQTNETIQRLKEKGQKDVAYIMVTVVAPVPTKTLISKYSDYEMVNTGDEVNYTIVVTNIYDQDLRNLVITDNYDEQYLQILSAIGGVNNGSTLQFRKTILRPGEIVKFHYTAKATNQGNVAVTAKNRATIFSDTMDLSKFAAEKSVIINPAQIIKRLAQTGTGNFTLIIALLAGTVAVLIRRKRGMEI